MSLSATLQQQEQLLNLQNIDTEIQQTRTLIDSLKNDSEYAELKNTGQQLQRRRQEIAAQLKEKQEELTNITDTAAATSERQATLRHRLEADSGSTKELTAISDELDMLADLVKSQEEAQLAAMQEAEEVESILSKLDAELAELKGQAVARNKDLQQQGSAAVSRGKELMAQRSQVAKSLPEDLLSAYDEARVRNGGIGVARLEGNRSAASGTPISPAELAEIHALPENEIARCPETDALLIR